MWGESIYVAEMAGWVMLASKAGMLIPFVFAISPSTIICATRAQSTRGPMEFDARVFGKIRRLFVSLKMLITQAETGSAGGKRVLMTARDV